MDHPSFCENQPPDGDDPTISQSSKELSCAALDNMDDITLAGSDEHHPLRLHSEYIVQPGSSVWITSTYPVKIFTVSGYGNGTPEVYCSHPFRLEVSRKTVIIPQVPLQERFADGWNKCPNETKLRILGYNLSFKNPMFPTHYVPESASAYECLFTHLRMTPEIAALSTEFFYTNNEFLLFAKQDYRNAYYFKLPMQHIVDFVRRIRVIVPLGHVRQENFLEPLAKIGLSFPHLRHLVIVLQWARMRGCSDASSKAWDPDDQERWFTETGVKKLQDCEFKYEGHIEFRSRARMEYFTDHIPGGPQWHDVYASPEVQTALEEWIASKAFFRPSSQRLLGSGDSSQGQRTWEDAIVEDDICEQRQRYVIS
ncbi:hypothetical protein N0V90_012455 [Kalmusia sp. IMI 367209]|nr:hypothetical protein N0V90_012455 [Kalmusia sp. IMI 367209]